MDDSSAISQLPSTMIRSSHWSSTLNKWSDAINDRRNPKYNPLPSNVFLTFTSYQTTIFCNIMGRNNLHFRIGSFPITNSSIVFNFRIVGFKLNQIYGLYFSLFLLLIVILPPYGNCGNVWVQRWEERSINLSFYPFSLYWPIIRLVPCSFFTQ